jgi:hypothetical protein
MYDVVFKKNAFANQQESSINVPEGTEVVVPKTMNEAKDKYIEDKIKDHLFDMKATKVPKGVWFSTFVMSLPLFAFSGYLAVLAPMASNVSAIDPTVFAYLGRTCLRLLSLNISFFGGIHYGLASA